MDAHKLRCFIAVIEKGSVSAAAEALHMTQPPLSMLLKKLENDLDVSLFKREANKLVPTATGKLFYKRAKEILANMESVKREIIETNLKHKETIRIGCSTAASLFVIPNVLDKIKDNERNFVTHVHEGETAYLIQRLRDHQLDLVLARSHYTGTDLESKIILSEPLLVALPKSHHLASNKSIQISDLKNENFLLHHSPTGKGISDAIIQACNKNGFQPNVTYWGIETLPMLLMVEKKLGIAFAPKRFKQLEAFTEVILKPVSFPSIKTNLSLITLKNHKPSELTKRFIKTIIEFQ